MKGGRLKACAQAEFFGESIWGNSSLQKQGDISTKRAPHASHLPTHSPLLPRAGATRCQVTLVPEKVWQREVPVDDRARHDHALHHQRGGRHEVRVERQVHLQAAALVIHNESCTVSHLRAACVRHNKSWMVTMASHVRDMDEPRRGH